MSAELHLSFSIPVYKVQKLHCLWALAQERRSRQSLWLRLRRERLSYFTLILSDSHAACFIVRRVLLEIFHKAFHEGKARVGWVCGLQLQLQGGVSDEVEKKTGLQKHYWKMMPGKGVELRFWLLSGEWWKYVPWYCTSVQP